jgi:hypothetical protein
MPILCWDFFGPNAEGSARHFRKHLDEFLSANECAGCSTGVRSEGEGHHAAFCDAPEGAAAAIARALRPRRVTPGGEEQR